MTLLLLDQNLEESRENKLDLTMEIEIVSKHVVKPSSPTPPHLRTYKLSVLDQLMPSAHVPMVFFYANHTNDNLETISRKIERIRESLSESLITLYMFAGQIKNDLHIHCNDNGIPYFDARVNCSVSEFLRNPDKMLLRRLLPHVPLEPTGIHVVAIQVNVFSCGGIAIGTKTSHRIIDGPTSTTLLHLWSAKARGCTGTPTKPDFSAPTLFPQNESLPKDKMLSIWPSLLKFGKCVTKRFVFNAAAIATLKASAASPSFVEHPSRVEAVAAFVWKRAIAISKARYGYQKPSAWTHVVNLRGKKGKASTPISDHAVGNLLWLASAQCGVEEGDAELPALVGAQRTAITRLVNDGFGEKIQGEDGFGKILEGLNELGKAFSIQDTDYYTCSSMCKVGIYESDFGWGKPIWVSPGAIEGFVYQNLVFLIETPGKGNGIEVWVTIGEEDMSIMEADEELLKFASLDPSPMDLQ